MKKFAFLLSFIFLSISSQGQTPSKQNALKIKESTEKHYKKILQNSPHKRQPTLGNRSLITQADTVILTRNNVLEELFVYSYDLVYGRNLPVGVSYFNYIEGLQIENLFSYNEIFQVIEARIKLTAEGEEPVDILVKLSYDASGTLIGVEQSFELFGFPFTSKDSLIIERNELNLPTLIRNESSIEFFLIQEIQPNIEIREIDYREGVPVTFVQTDFFVDEEDVLDSISNRYRSVEWFQYSGQLLERAALDFSTTDLLSESFVPQPDKSHTEDLISGEVDFWLEGNWEKVAAYTLEERTPTTLVVSRAGISLERFAYVFDENNNVTRKDYYYELDEGSLSVRTDISYNEYELPLAYRIYTLENDSLVLSENYDYRYDIDNWNRLTRITSDDFERTIVDFIYVIATSLKEERQTNNSTLVYPNPAKERIYLQHKEIFMGETHYRLLNADGALARTSKIHHPHSTLEFEVSGLPPGQYFMRIENENSVQLLKVILL
jgi:hypothetical protein